MDYLIDLIQSDPSAVLIHSVMLLRGPAREPHPAWKPTRLGEW
ncbi:MAG TPA: hypothetical protein VIF83_04425 [Gemmatimonadaceae bacterium]